VGDSKRDQTIVAVKEMMKEAGGWPENLPPLAQVARYLRKQYPEWVWPAARSHVPLSMIGAPDLYKVFTEPGGIFSPGVRTIGISPWVLEGGHLFCPENLKDDEQNWRLEHGYLPVVTSSSKLGDLQVSTELVSTGNLSERQGAVYYRVTLRPTGSEAFNGKFVLAVRWIGPAGGLIRQISYSPTDRSLTIDGRRAVIANTVPSGAKVASLEGDGSDLSVLLPAGTARELNAEHSETGILSAAMVYNITLRPGEQRVLEFICPLLSLSIPPQARTFAAARERELASWRELFGHISIDTPDPAINESLLAIMTHIRWWSVDGILRHSPVTYPVTWLRDAAMMDEVFDKFDLESLARPTADYAANNLYASGFGAEGDAPGQGIWSLAEYYRYTHDKEWLDLVWPRVVDKRNELMRLLHATSSVRRLREPILPFVNFEEDMDIVADPAQDGLITGRMDWHRPVIWINTWTVAGLEAASFLAKESGHAAEAEEYDMDARLVREALTRYAATNMGKDERDFACAVWPTRAFNPDDPIVKRAFEKRWQQMTTDTGRYELRSEWSYFDIANAHTQLWMGERDRMWQILGYYLKHQHAPGMYLWREGPPTDADRSLNWSRVAGWIDHPTVIPHGWVASEVALLVRDLFVYEENEHLVFGAGIPDEWLKAGDRVAVSGFETYWGKVGLEVESNQNQIVVTLTLPQGSPDFELRLPDDIPIRAAVVEGAEAGRKSSTERPIWKPAATLVRIMIPR
jgi:hypothetical protein